MITQHEIEFRGKLVYSTQKLFTQHRKGIINLQELETKLIELMVTD